MKGGNEVEYPFWVALLASLGGPGLVAYFANLALKDRDKRITDIEEWKEAHEKEHINAKEIIRMHEETREWMKGIAESQERNRTAAESNFLHVMERIDKLIARDHNTRGGDNR